MCSPLGQRHVQYQATDAVEAMRIVFYERTTLVVNESTGGLLIIWGRVMLALFIDATSRKETLAATLSVSNGSLLDLRADLVLSWPLILHTVYRKCLSVGAPCSNVPAQPLGNKTNIAHGLLCFGSARVASGYLFLQPFRVPLPLVGSCLTFRQKRQLHGISLLCIRICCTVRAPERGYLVLVVQSEWQATRQRCSGALCHTAGQEKHDAA